MVAKIRSFEGAKIMGLKKGDVKRGIVLFPNSEWAMPLDNSKDCQSADRLTY